MTDLRENVPDAFREALRELLSWQPQTEMVRADLHPQHRDAIERAEALLCEET